MAADFSVVLDELNTTLKSIEAVLRVDDMRNEIADLEQQAAAAYDQARLEPQVASRRRRTDRERGTRVRQPR